MPLTHDIVHGNLSRYEKTYPIVARLVREAVKGGVCPFCGRHSGPRTAWHMMTSCGQQVARLVKLIKARAPEEKLLELLVVPEVVEA